MAIKVKEKKYSGWNEEYYQKCHKELEKLIPDDDKRRILSQKYCELEPNFFCFANVYKPLSELIPKECTVIDFGCYLAAQAYYFKDHRKYIGVDVVNMERFTPDNAEQYIGTIQDYIEYEVPKLFDINDSVDNLRYYAICSYVPDFEAVELVRKTFMNVACYYPTHFEN